MSEKDIKYHILLNLASSKNGLYLSQFYLENCDFLDFFKILMDLQKENFVEKNKVSKKYFITQKGLEELKNLKKQA
jgi:predicted transcriptional regulator